YIFEQGTKVGVAAQERFPGGVLVAVPSYRASEALAQTRALMAAGVPALFEAAFFHDNILVRVDVLRRVPSAGSATAAGDAWELIEVKSSTTVKPEHLPDVAVQRYVLEGCGVRVRRTCLMHLNPGCTFPDLSDLFTEEELTGELDEPARAIPEHLERFREALRLPREPNVAIGPQCTSPYECPFIPWCWRRVPKVSIFNIPRLGAEHKRELAACDLLRIEDLPVELPLSPAQSRFVELYRLGRAEIDWTAIRRELEGLTFPLYFLDFETDSPAIPRYPGTRPYEKVPFQYSCHRLEPGGALSQGEYLHAGQDDPRPELARSLLEWIGPEGSLVVYNASFERGVLQGLARELPRHAPGLLALAERLWDLLEIFRRYYLDPAFGGSNSIKSVLPVLVPEMSYGALEVQDGTQAQAAWNRLLVERSPVRRKALEQALRAYCGQDSLAMVEIYRVLLRGLEANPG
ncbi:MAG: DUF2779 domain-containing protein, partial [Spirochaetales bacterium]|nr:DUF2779 domain-containing protein [Spirochaetales bacterium]